MNSKNLRIAVLMILDAVIVVLGAFFAIALRFDISELPAEYMDNVLKSTPVYIAITIAIMLVFRLYNRVWSYASMKELMDIFKASFVIEALIISFHVLMQYDMPRSYYPMHFIAIAFMFAVLRFSKQLYRSIRGTYGESKINKFILVIGAGSAASILIKDINKTGSTSKIVCAVDDNVNKKGKMLMGVPIVGTRDDVKRAVKKYNVNEIIIAMPSAASEDIKKIIAICQETKLPVKILPSVAKSLSSSIVRELRAISYEDLLGRDAIEVDATGINNFIKDKTILITGGGGSIGSELCRQVIRYEPKRLIIFDIYENNAYEIQMELERHYPYAEIITLIGSIRDYDRLEAMFDEYRPQIVYHAAAHKHVPLMEDSPNEAIKNNCLGTLNLVKLADKYLVDNFTLISTDKAVRPTNIMGASKRICEMIVQVYARKSEHTRYSAVRFGNVLGSNGSVIPLFLKQIEEGGPVTVTHKDIRRFFMTIPEAVSLVLQASLFAKGGEIFVLDMGEPVKIYELAENLIKMKGFRPHQDIEIEVVGLRPGEKLYEEVLMDEEGLNKTENNMIFVGQPIKMDDDEFLTSLDTLIRESEKNDGNIKGLVEGVCKTYTITENKKTQF